MKINKDTEVVQILMQRDDLSLEEAIAWATEVYKAMEDALDGGNYLDVEEIFTSELGLEPDYIFSFFEF